MSGLQNELINMKNIKYFSYIQFSCALKKQLLTFNFYFLFFNLKFANQVEYKQGRSEIFINWIKLKKSNEKIINRNKVQTKYFYFSM
jgi:hypothetical protein